MNTPDIWREIAPHLTSLQPAFPRNAVLKAKAHWADVAPHMLAALEEAGSNPDAVADDQMLHLFAMYLAAELRDTRAHGALVRIARLPEVQVDFLVGDAVTESLASCLASTCDGDETGLRGVVEDTTGFVWARNAAMDALAIRTLHGEAPMEPLQRWMLAVGEREAELARADAEYSSGMLNQIAHSLAELRAA